MWSLSNRLSWCVALLLASLIPVSAAGLRQSCHIHPPADLVEAGAAEATVGPYASLDACEQARVLTFSDQGRCHCVSAFAARALPGGVGRGDRRALPGGIPGPAGQPLP